MLVKCFIGTGLLTPFGVKLVSKLLLGMLLQGVNEIFFACISFPSDLMPSTDIHVRLTWIKSIQSGKM